MKIKVEYGMTLSDALLCLFDESHWAQQAGLKDGFAVFERGAPREVRRTTGSGAVSDVKEWADEPCWWVASDQAWLTPTSAPRPNAKEKNDG